MVFPRLRGPRVSKAYMWEEKGVIEERKTLSSYEGKLE